MIRGCIVEDHSDVVPFLLKQWKAEAAAAAAASQPRVLVHYDAHPDLSLNVQTSQAQCSRLAAMVEHLAGSSGGIAEFILPLFYCGYLDQCIWVKPQWAAQLRDGEHVFELGVDRASGFMRVACCEDYYLDEEVVVPDVGQLADPKTVSLLVLDEAQAADRLPALLEGKQWVFDCCLDFFTCSNPFVADLVRSGVSQQHIDAIQALYANAPHRVLSRLRRCGRQQPAAGDRGCELKLIRTAASFNQLVKQAFEADDHETRALLAPALKQLYSDDDSGGRLVDDFLAALESLTAEQKQLVQEAAYCMNLPHRITSVTEQDAMLQQIRDTMVRLRKHPPSCVTIARSAIDGFTPMGDAERLQHEVLAILSECFARPVQIARLETATTATTSDDEHKAEASSTAAATTTTTTTTIPTATDEVIRLFDIREDPSLYSHFAIHPNSLHKRKLTSAVAAQGEAQADSGRSWRIESLPRVPPRRGSDV